MQPESNLNGHPARTKIRAVEASTGPLGHGLPIAVGTAIAGKLDGSSRRTFVVTGDGELQEGSNWEAIMTAGHHGLANLCLVVDRNRLQQGARVADTNDLEPLPEKFAAFGMEVVEVDGHDHGALVDAFANVPAAVRQADRHRGPHLQGPPHLVHVRRRRVAPQGPLGRPGRHRPHRAGAEVTTSTATPAAARTLHDCRDAYVATLVELAEADPRIVAVVNDSVGSSKLGPFQKQFGERLINVGIAEQDMVGVAAGLANGGKIPFVSAAACFLTARAMEQIKVDAAYSRHHMVLCGMSPGMAYGELGPTHHSIEDLGWLRTIPGLTVLVPSDPTETAQAIRWAAQHDGPVFVRVSRMGVPDVNPEGYRFAPGQGGHPARRRRRDARRDRRRRVPRAGRRGPAGRGRRVGPRAVHAVDQAARHRRDPRRRPRDPRHRHGRGGPHHRARRRGRRGRRAAPAGAGMRFVGVPDTFAPTGSVEWLLDHFGISADGITAAARDLLGR